MYCVTRARTKKFLHPCLSCENSRHDFAIFFAHAAHILLQKGGPIYDEEKEKSSKT